MIVVDSLKYVVDIGFIIFLILGAVLGWRRGFITSLISFLFTVCVIIGAFYLKNYLSVILYENLPFFNFGGMFNEIYSLNILVYEGVAFIVCIIVLALLVFIITKVTDLINKLVNKTVILALPNKILGLVLTIFQFFIIGYFLLFIMIQVPYTNYLFGLNESKVASIVVDKTPGLSMITNKYYNTYKEVYNIIDRCHNCEDKSQANYDTLDVLMKNEVISVESVKKLKDKDRLKINNIDELINKYNK